MKPTSFLLPSAGVLGAGFLVLTAFANLGASASASALERTRIERGRYLVNNVAMCADCHSPRGPEGRFLEGKDLTGSALGFTPTVPMPWAPYAPGIAGLPAGYSAEDTVKFLMTGERTGGRPATLPPMPPYRFEREDAEAITAYLRSLPGNAVTITPAGR
jgi:mono/diheme cytochrome c family protein